MSNIAAAIRDHLKTESTVTAYVDNRVTTRRGRSERFRGSDGKVQPHIIVQQTPGDSVNHQGGAMNRMNPRVEVHCVARTDTDANKVEVAVLGVMNGLHEAYLGRQNLFVRSIVLAISPVHIEEPPKDGSEDPIFTDLLEFDVWHEQAVPVFA